MGIYSLLLLQGLAGVYSLWVVKPNVCSANHPEEAGAVGV